MLHWIHTKKEGCAIRYPAFLKKGEAIGYAAPSFGCSIEPYRSAFAHALQILEERGHPAVLGENVYASDGVGISTAPEKCGREITRMLLSEDTGAVLSCGGGELMCEILRHVDFEALRAGKPKWFMGYSDNTNLTFLLATLCDTAAVYGPCAPSFGMEPWHPAIEEAFRLLHGELTETAGYPYYEIESLKSEEMPLEPYHCTEPRLIRVYDPKRGLLPAGEGEALRVSGRLIGGCLDILATLCGTEFDRAAAFAERYREEGQIWFLEACDLNVFGIRRALWQLKNAGWFRHARGFLIGRPLTGIEDRMGLDHLHAVTDALGELSVPIVLDADLGHLPPMMPLITGSLAELSYTPAEDRFRLQMRLE